MCASEAVVGYERAMSADETNRLIRQGLVANVAMDVIDGKLDEEFEVSRAIEITERVKWSKGRVAPPADLTAQWDLDPAHFYLAYDGNDPDLHPGDQFALIEADVADVHGKLTYHSSRDKDPWHRQYRRGSEGTAFRWFKGLPVTPPLINRVGDQIGIQGGNHRYHLAHYYKTDRMPFLVLNEDLAAVLDLLPTAAVRTEPAA